MIETADLQAIAEPQDIAILGAGVIGAGWVARFALHGHRVRVYDLNPDAPQQVAAVVEQAQRHLPQLYEQAGSEPQIEYVDSLAAAVEGAQWVQESLPEDLGIKRAVLSELDGKLPDDVPVCSSTSGFKPTVMSEGLQIATQFMVCHPFNPVYLLPLVEVVPASRCVSTVVEEAMHLLRAVNMRPLQVRAEIDAHIADRLLEAVWREALWMVHDGVATTGEIDDAIKHGFGLRWAQMGLFETYRLGGGKTGMRQFIQQFGPALQWPWSKLTDVPEMSAELVERIVQQSDAQAAGESIDEMLERRDGNLVAIIKALADQDAK